MATATTMAEEADSAISAQSMINPDATPKGDESEHGRAVGTWNRSIEAPGSSEAQIDGGAVRRRRIPGAAVPDPAQRRFSSPRHAQMDHHDGFWRWSAS
jgi:hypothetical protein